MNKVLIISGPTATGKTDLAIKLAKQFNGELISADSRQIYKGMDIGTGKDHSKNIHINLIDLINPDQSFSVAQYRKLAIEKIEEIQNKGKLPIIVGGTGLYIDSIINSNCETYSIKPNHILRTVLKHFSVPNLQKIYKFLNKSEYIKLNNSEVHNPHRLIRKIEITLSPKKILSVVPNNKFDYLHISLTAPNDHLYQKIDKRVESRLKLGLLEEINKLLKKYTWSDIGLNTLAYKEFKKYFAKSFNVKSVKEPYDATLKDCIQQWKFDEHAYARRQKTWFKNKTNINSFDITQNLWEQNVFETASEWYNKP